VTEPADCLHVSEWIHLSTGVLDLQAGAGEIVGDEDPVVGVGSLVASSKLFHNPDPDPGGKSVTDVD